MALATVAVRVEVDSTLTSEIALKEKGFWSVFKSVAKGIGIGILAVGKVAAAASGSYHYGYY